MYMNDGNKTKINLRNKSVFITGVAGFIGSNLAKRLLSTVEGVKVVGLDNMNHYYDVRLKEARLNELEQFDNFSFVKGNLADKAVIESIFEQYKPEIVVNLGAQAGVRYSITNPDAYVEANLIGFYNILEACRHSYDEGHTPVEHLVYASSSSVYGSNKKVPYSTDDKVDNPVSLYAATKKSNELMAHKAILEPFLKRMPDKTFHYVASYMLKGYAMEKKGIAEKYRASSYKTLKRKIPSLLDILDNAYGKSYCKISNPTLVNNEVDLGITNANKGKSRAITHSFGTKLKALMLGEEVEITFCDVQGTKKTYKFTEVERMSFVLFGILYASRCNNFHGNVAARMNSINANKDTFKMYTDMFLTEYIILAIHLNSQGALSDVVLNKVKKNANLMI